MGDIPRMFKHFTPGHEEKEQKSRVNDMFLARFFSQNWACMFVDQVWLQQIRSPTALDNYFHYFNANF